jgi:hypothetical protein
MELMVEFIFVRASNTFVHPLYIGRQQRALLHRQDLIYYPVYRNGQAHRRLRRPRGLGGKTCRRSSRRSIAKRLLLAARTSPWCLFCEMEASRQVYFGRLTLPILDWLSTVHALSSGRLSWRHIRRYISMDSQHSSMRSDQEKQKKRVKL